MVSATIYDALLVSPSSSPCLGCGLAPPWGAEPTALWDFAPVGMCHGGAAAWDPFGPLAVGGWAD